MSSGGVTGATDSRRHLHYISIVASSPPLRRAWRGPCGQAEEIGMPKLSHALFGVASALALSIGAAQAQNYQIVPEVLQQAAPAPARYIVRATTLYANRAGHDPIGSDEIYAEFTLRTPDRAGGEEFFARTTTFGDFDARETKRFREWENCLTSVVVPEAQRNRNPVRAWDCHPQGDRINLTFDVRLYDEDPGDDDFIGERTVRWTTQELDSANLAVGQRSSESIRIGDYTMTWDVIRVS